MTIDPSWFIDMLIQSVQSMKEPHESTVEPLKRQSLVTHLLALGTPDPTRSRDGLIRFASPVAVPFAVFFDGNMDLSSFASNATPQGGIPEVRESLAVLADVPGVLGVYILVKDIETRDAASWPYSDEVLIHARCAKRGVASKLRRLRPDSFGAISTSESFPGEPAFDVRTKRYLAWWD